MFWMLTEGLSWPGGLSDGRFNIFRLPGSEEDIAAHLEHCFRVDDRERSCIEMWADDGFVDQPGSSGIRVRVFIVSDTSASNIDRIDEKYWAELRSAPAAYCAQLHRRAQVVGEARSLARAYSNPGCLATIQQGELVCN